MCEKHHHHHLSCANRRSISLSRHDVDAFQASGGIPECTAYESVLGCEVGLHLDPHFSLSLPGSKDALQSRDEGVGGWNKRKQLEHRFSKRFFFLVALFDYTNRRKKRKSECSSADRENRFRF